MDRRLHALVTRDVLADTVRIDVRGSLNGESRPSLVHLVRRVRSMGVSSHILVDLSRAAFVESAALAGLRNDLNSIDDDSVAGSAGPGVSLVLTATSDGASLAGSMGEQSLVITDELVTEYAGAVAREVADGSDGQGGSAAGATLSQPLSGYTDGELFAASDAAFALLDNPEALGGSDLLARYDEIGAEISRRNLLSGLDELTGGQQTA